MRSTPQRRRRGFSLLELVVVLMILAIVAGLTVSIVDWIRRSANYAAAANNQQALLENLQLYRTTFGNGGYPDRFDSLLEGGAVHTLLEPELQGLITPTELETEELNSLSKGGITTVMDHTSTLTSVIEGNPGNTGITPRTLSSDATVALLNTGAATQIVGSIYPTGLPSDVRLVLLGVGPGNTAIGKTLHAPPFYTATDPTAFYNRFIMLTAVYNPRAGRRAQMKAILDSKGRIAVRNLSEFWQSTNPD